MIDEVWEEQASLYALGALERDETAVFEARLTTDRELAECVKRLQAAVEALAVSTATRTPPAGLKSRVMARLPARRVAAVIPLPVQPQGRRGSWASWGLAAAFAAGCLLLAASLAAEKRRAAVQAVRANEERQSGERVVAELTGKVQSLTGALASLQQKFDEALAGAKDEREQWTARNGGLEREIQRLREKNQLAGAQIVFLGSLLQGQPKAVAVSVWNPDRQEGVFVVKDLLPLAADQDYQLWVIDPQMPQPVDAGTFVVDPQGAVRLQFKPRAAVNTAGKFAVTIEKKGGAPTPNLKQLVLIGG